MANFSEIALEEALRHELGKKANFRLYDRNNRSPMNLVIDEAERQTGSRFSVYWVDGGAPEVFCLPGFSPGPVVFSTRYLSLTTYFRQLIMQPFHRDRLVNISERTALRVMSELALRHGEADYAVLAFIKSSIHKGILLSDDWLSEDDQVEALEYEPTNEAYMATWFYGLTHELGHLAPIQTGHFSDEHTFTDARMLELIEMALDNFHVYPDFVRKDAINIAKERRSQSVLGIDNVRSEGLADIFATSVLFQTTCDIMKEINQERFDITRFIQEMIIFLNIITFINMCRRVAKEASATTVDRDAQLEALWQPVSMTVRALMQRQYLEIAVTAHLFNSDKLSADQFQRIRKMINEINEGFAETNSSIESGLARAMEFSLYPERRENDWALLEAFRRDLTDSTLSLQHAKRFCELADSLEVDSKLLRALKEIVESPNMPVHPDPTGDFVYFVPWVKGPNGLSRPFGLDTKYGHLVFVFQDQGERYEAFFDSSVETLKPGFTLEKAAVPAPRKKRLGPELTSHMPPGKSFGIVIEGTETFEKFMRELAEGTIWEE